MYVAFPPEVSQPGTCAKLRRSLYGTRAAPARWGAPCADSRASGLPGGRRARVASTTPSWT
eukprot:7696489-Alexandrium_andersonii.AAC.1